MRLALRASLRLFKFIPDNFVIGNAGICGDDGAFLVDVFRNPQFLKTGFYRFQYGLQSVVFLAFAKGLGINDDLVFFYPPWLRRYSPGSCPCLSSFWHFHYRLDCSSLP